MDNGTMFAQQNDAAMQLHNMAVQDALRQQQEQETLNNMAVQNDFMQQLLQQQVANTAIGASALASYFRRIRDYFVPAKTSAHVSPVPIIKAERDKVHEFSPSPIATGNSMAFGDLDNHTQLDLLRTAKKAGQAENVTVPKSYMSAVPDEQLRLELAGTLRALAKEYAKDPRRVEEIKGNSDGVVSQTGAFEGLSGHIQMQVLNAAKNAGQAETKEVKMLHGVINETPKEDIVRELLGAQRALAKELARNPQRVEEIQRNPANVVVYTAAVSTPQKGAVRE